MKADIKPTKQGNIDRGVRSVVLTAEDDDDAVVLAFFAGLLIDSKRPTIRERVAAMVVAENTRTDGH